MAEKAGWVPIVAVLGIIMGCFGIFGGIQYISMPQIMKMQKEYMPKMMNIMNKDLEEKQALHEKTRKEAGITYTAKNYSDSYKEMMDKFLNYPAWYNTFSYIAGAIGIIVGAFYLYASIMLMQRKKLGLKLFYAAAIIAIVFVIARGIGTFMAMSSLFAASALAGSLFSLIINAVLLSVAVNGDKKGLV